MMQILWQDVRYGIRMLRNNPGFTFIAVLTLALGIGANTAIFSLVDKLLLRTLPVVDPDQLVLLSSESVSPHFINNIFSYPDYVDYRDQNQVFSGLIASCQSRVNLSLSGEVESANVSLVSINYFDVLGVKPLRGRMISPEEGETPGKY